jgi:YegS/Rv2252/BmrU family lipid kinase
VKPGFDPSRPARYLEKHGVATTLVVPGSAAEATERAREAAQRGDHLCFVIGGDGTVRDVALGLAGSETALAAVPGGTVNIWAKESGVPRGLKRALDAHLAGKSVHMDLGLANGHCFLLMAGIGWDAKITANVSKKLKKATGDVAYMIQGALMAPGLRSKPTRWRAGDALYDEPLAWMVLGNSRLYGGKIHLTRDATIDDGLLDMLAMCPTGLTDTLRLAGKLLAGKREDARLFHDRVAEVHVETPGLPVQLDGDYAGETPMTFSVQRGGLLVSVPEGPLPPIFAREHTNRRPG